MIFKNRILLIISALIIIFLISGAYAFGILCIGDICVNKGAVEINKLVSNPKTLKMVDNLGVDDPKYHLNAIVNFQLRIKNPTNSKISGVTVKDIFPQYVDFDEGAGSFDPKTKILAFDIKNLTAGEERVLNFSGRIAKEIPASQKSLCVSNQVSAVVKSGKSTSDTSKFCIATLTSSPATGTKSLALLLLAPAGIIGWTLRRYPVRGRLID